MLTFFRRIRKGLLDGGATSKYLLYAIGEIALVVIGILIALQINTWNIELLERSEEIDILTSVKSDLGNTIAELEFLNQIRDKVLFGTREIYLMVSSEEYNERKLDSLLGLTFYRPTYNNNLGSIDLLFSSGKINLIKNDSIREFLITWPGSIDDMSEEEVYAMALFQNSYYPTVAQYAIVQDVLKQAFSTSFFASDLQEEEYSDLPLGGDYEGLFKDKEFFNHLRMRASHIQITKSETKDLILQAKYMIEKINYEIKF